MEPWGCYVAEENDSKIVGAAIAVCWGSVGLFGPVAVLTPYQNQKIAQQLLKATQGFFDENHVTMQGLVTYPYSPKHLVLYQKFGFKPKSLVAITGKSLERREPAPPAKPVRGAPQVQRYSALEESKKKAILGRLRAMTGKLYRGPRPHQGDRDRQRARARGHADPGEGPRHPGLRHMPYPGGVRGSAGHALHQARRDRSGAPPAGALSPSS